VPAIGVVQNFYAGIQVGMGVADTGEEGIRARGIWRILLAAITIKKNC